VIAFGALLLVASFTSAALASSKREPQNYYGPKEDKVKPALLWVPRVVLFPVWLVSEYVVRQPVGLLVRTAEANQWPAAVVQFFTFGERGQVTLFPSALFDFGFKPSVGFNLGWKYFLAEPNTLSVHAGFWGPDWVALRANDQYTLGTSEAVSAAGKLVRRRDLVFYGMGPRSPSKPKYRYQAMTTEFALGYEQGFWRLSQMTIQVGLRTLSFGDRGCCGDTSVSTAVASGALPSPPGFGAGYIAEFQSLSVAIDSRRPSPADGTGVRVEAHGEAVVAPARDSEPRRAWVGYGASVGAALDVKGGRTFGLGVATDLTDPLHGTIPFTDQVTLGGNRPMRGYLQGRLVDRSSIVATAQYTWPIWIYLNGVVQVDVGNVFGPRLSGFDVDLLRMSTGIGVRSIGSPDSGLELLVAGGTDPFESGFRYSSFRLVIGSHHGF
jgi:Omp85 superfamily domain